MLETYYRLLVHDEEKKLIKDSGLIPSHSYVLQFLQFLRACFAMADISAKDVDGATSVLADVSDDINRYGRVNAPAQDDTYGTVIGTNAGTTAEDNENYQLDTKILHSHTEEANKMNYQAVTFVAPTVDGANVDYDITRTFLNESGGTITVKEIGLICKNVADAKYHLLLRDVVSDEAVLDDYTLTVVYTLRTTV